MQMRRAGGGSVINTASFVALLGAATPQLACKFQFPFFLVVNNKYLNFKDTASKGAVLAMT
jgi:NAD(P)-dependent dehydrogenase (short-subunit alcohol dehydrogenase family)